VFSVNRWIDQSAGTSLTEPRVPAFFCASRRAKVELARPRSLRVENGFRIIERTHARQHEEAVRSGGRSDFKIELSGGQRNRSRRPHLSKPRKWVLDVVAKQKLRGAETVDGKHINTAWIDRRTRLRSQHELESVAELVRHSDSNPGAVSCSQPTIFDKPCADCTSLSFDRTQSERAGNGPSAVVLIQACSTQFAPHRRPTNAYSASDGDSTTRNGAIVQSDRAADLHEQPSRSDTRAILGATPSP
jgi:hypothetical protein